MSSGRSPSRTSARRAISSPTSGRRAGGRDGYVSLEVDPRLAYDTLATFREAMSLHETVERPNLMVKIPATVPGLACDRGRDRSGKVDQHHADLLARTLRAGRRVLQSAGLERLVAGGGDPRKVASVASFFVCGSTPRPTGAWRDRRTRPPQGKLAVANARLAYQRYSSIFAGPRWEFLQVRAPPRSACCGLRPPFKDPLPTRCTWRSYRPDTINTMPEETIHGNQTTGTRARRLASGMGQARHCSPELAGRRSRLRGPSPGTLEAEGCRNSPTPSGALGGPRGEAAARSRQPERRGALSCRESEPGP